MLALQNPVDYVFTHLNATLDDEASRRNGGTVAVIGAVAGTLGARVAFGAGGGLRGIAAEVEVTGDGVHGSGRGHGGKGGDENGGELHFELLKKFLV